VLVYGNDSEAVVQGGALLNQELAWRNDAINPHPNQAAEAPDGKGEQVVSIEATNYQQTRSEEHTSELQSHLNLVCRLLLEKKNKHKNAIRSQQTTSRRKREEEKHVIRS